MTAEEVIRKMWSSNAFMNVLKIQIQELHCGGATLVMPIDFDIHTNHWLGVHGGAMAALCDCVNGITCATIGKIAQTLNMNINYIGNIKGFGDLTIRSEVIHSGMSTINISSKLMDSEQNIICDCSTVMFVRERLAEVPEKW